MNIDRAISLILSNAKDADSALLAYCEAERISLAALCNELALAIAAQFLGKQVDFDFGDDVMNHLMGFMTSTFFLSRNENTVPEPAWSVYLAFDRGEYWSEKTDRPDETPSEKYTRPMLESLVASHSKA